MQKDTKNTEFQQKIEVINGCANSIPALGTSKTVSISNRSGFSVTGTNVPPKVPPKFGTGKFFRNMGTQPKYKEPKIVRAKRGWFIALAYLRPDGQGYKRGSYRKFGE